MDLTHVIAARDALTKFIDANTAKPASTVRTDRQPAIIPPLTVPPVGGTIADPLFNTTILRVTGLASGESYRTPSGSERAWNADGTLFYVVTTSGSVVFYRFDPVAMKATPVAVPPNGYRFTEPTWSQTDPAVCYAMSTASEEPVVVEVRVGDGTYASKKVFSAHAAVPEIVGRGRTYLRGIGHANGLLTCICGGGSQDRDDVAVVVELSTGKTRILKTGSRPTIDGRPLAAPMDFALHACQLDLSGHFLVLGAVQEAISRGRAANWVWDVRGDVVLPMNASAGGHGALGYGQAVNAPDDMDSQEYRLRSLSSPNDTKLLITALPKPAQFQAANHLNWNHAKPNANTRVIVANYRYGSGVDVTAQNPWREWDNEIIAVATDGSGTVQRFCHHRSDIRHDQFPASHLGYWYTPRPKVSADGKWCLFTSNWGKTLGVDAGGRGEGTGARQDVFLAELKV